MSHTSTRSRRAALAKRIEDNSKQHGACRLWCASVFRGYAILTVDGTKHPAAHVARYAATGRWPKRLHRSCNVRRCVALEHLKEPKERTRRGRITIKPRKRKAK